MKQVLATHSQKTYFEVTGKIPWRERYAKPWFKTRGTPSDHEKTSRLGRATRGKRPAQKPKAKK